MRSTKHGSRLPAEARRASAAPDPAGPIPRWPATQERRSARAGEQAQTEKHRRFLPDEGPSGAVISGALRAIKSFVPGQIFPHGVELFQQGAQPDTAYVLSEGLVKLHRDLADGGTCVVSLRSTGWTVGAAAVILNLPHTATASTVTRCLVHAIPARQFRRLVRSRDELSWCLHTIHSQEVREQMTRMADLACTPARRRLEAFLTDLAVTSGCPEREGEFRLQLPLRHWEIAQLIGIAAPYLSDLLAELEREQVLRRHKGWLILKAPLQSAPHDGS